MSFRIAFDLDGVFADMAGALRRLAGVPPAPETDAPSADDNLPDDARELSSDEGRRAWRLARRTRDFWETLDELEPGTLARLHELSRQRRWHVVFVTQRPATAGDTPQLQSQRWLARHGFEHPSVLVVPGARGKLALALGLDVVVDDVPAACLDVKLESPARSWLIWRRDEGALPPGTRRLGIEVFGSVGACLDHLGASDPPRPAARPGLLRSIAHRLGGTSPSR